MVVLLIAALFIVSLYLYTRSVEARDRRSQISKVTSIRLKLWTLDRLVDRIGSRYSEETAKDRSLAGLIFIMPKLSDRVEYYNSDSLRNSAIGKIVSDLCFLDRGSKFLDRLRSKKTVPIFGDGKLRSDLPKDHITTEEIDGIRVKIFAAIGDIDEFLYKRVTQHG